MTDRKKPGRTAPRAGSSAALLGELRQVLDEAREHDCETSGRTVIKIVLPTLPSRNALRRIAVRAAATVGAAGAIFGGVKVGLVMAADPPGTGVSIVVNEPGIAAGPRVLDLTVTNKSGKDVPLKLALQVGYSSPYSEVSDDNFHIQASRISGCPTVGEPIPPQTDPVSTWIITDKACPAVKAGQTEHLKLTVRGAAKGEPYYVDVVGLPGANIGYIPSIIE